jgi:peptidyl-prolyl cis-trans isomerase C
VWSGNLDITTDQMKSRILFTAAAVVALLLQCPGCSRHSTPATVSVNVLAKVGGKEITLEDFENEIRWYGEHRRTLPSKEALLEQMISRELRVQKARSLGLDRDPGVRRSYETALAAKLEEHELGAKLDGPQVSAQEVTAAYQKEIAHYTRAAKVRLALIWLKTDRKMSGEKIAELEARMAEAQKLAKAQPPTTQGFGIVAADYSEDQSSRYKGGDVGWFDLGAAAYRWPSNVVSAGFALQNNGDISEVIKASDGLYLVSRLDTRDSVVTPLEQVQNSIQHRLRAEKREQANIASAQELRAFAPIQTFPQALQSAPYPTATLASAQEPRPPATTVSP